MPRVHSSLSTLGGYSASISGASQYTQRLLLGLLQSIDVSYLRKFRLVMAGTACFVIVSRNDNPIYETDVGTAAKKDEAAHLHQFILHAALDIVQDVEWTTNTMYLKVVDKFNDLLVSVYVTAGHTRLMLLHDARNEDGIRTFFQEVHELYLKILMNPLYVPGSKIASPAFDARVRALAKRHF